MVIRTTEAWAEMLHGVPWQCCHVFAGLKGTLRFVNALPTEMEVAYEGNTLAVSYWRDQLI